jgi:hypothetical protein
MFKEKIFSDESYIEILKIIQKYSYEFIKITDNHIPNVNKKYFLLRHDVDMSPYGAVKLGKIEADNNIVANYFFQLNAGTYQLLSSLCIDICKELQSMGHVVGLHVDSALFSEKEDKIRGTIDWMRDNLFPMDYAISFHRPQPKSLGRKYDCFVSAYDSVFFNTDFYASDSKGEDRFYERLELLLKSNATFIQLLLHPCWWENETDRNEIYHTALRRKQEELDSYLLNNFPKVFGSVIKKGS